MASDGEMLRAAAASNDVHALKDLLGQGVPVNSVDEVGNAALHRAAMFGAMACTKFLLEAKAALDRPNLSGNTPLHWATLHGHQQVAQLLVEHGANPDVSNNRGDKPRTHGGRWLEEGVFRWNEANRPDKLAMEKLVTKMQAGDNRSADVLAAVDAVLAHSRTIDETTDERGLTALHWAAWRGYASLCKALILRGANIEARTQTGRTPLHLAAGAGQAETVIELLHCGAPALVRDTSGMTSVLLASQCNQPVCARILAQWSSRVHDYERKPMATGTTEFIHSRVHDYERKPMASGTTEFTLPSLRGADSTVITITAA
eukprot:gnl/MRDRNA2_/MRDRNA2_100477_c0_seq1.p1 gnl/MRDRNA2_/MRDRNA2_100477_c0~~gnl/MRDRNA2_/MRDRNA2_100477_c0_seq1.p1  ORF type:complete len:332 (-),score=66.00 gnl/MRDRNA2_/MRDRNA2_100477_c0_seq1:119-1069(-)